jgi:hypothetical protein
MSTRLALPLVAVLALAVMGCEQGTTKKDVAQAQNKVAKKQQDVQKAQANAQEKIAAQQENVDKARHEAMKPVVDDNGNDQNKNKAEANGDVQKAEQKLDKTKADTNAKVQKAQADVQEAKTDLQNKEAKFKQTQDRDAFLKQVDQQLAAADQKIDQLKKDKDNAKDNPAKQQVQDKIDKLQAQRDRVNDAEKEMKKADVLKWQGHQKNVQTQLAELDNLMKQ